MTSTTTADGSAAVHFLRRDAVERAAIRKEFEVLNKKDARRALEDARAEEVDARMEGRRLPPPASGDQ
jgi:hypothetical protein